MGMSTKKGPMADINVTPLVDVMLVLLVIFMVTAPMLFSGIKLTLPKTSKVNTIHLNSKFVVLSLTAKDQLFIGKEQVLRGDLVNQLQNHLSQSKTDTVYLRADYQIKYERVAHLMAMLKNSGFTNIALVTQEDGVKN